MKGKLDEVRKQKLNSIGFTWSEDRKEKLDNKFDQLVAWYRENGHFKFPAKSKLGIIAEHIRKKYQNNKLSVEKAEQLSSMSFNFKTGDSRNKIREKRIQQVEKFFELYGHARITHKNETHNGLTNWLTLQRKFYKKKALTDDMVKKMEAAGVDWYHQKNASVQRWNSNYERLLKLKRETGKFTIPAGMGTLASWSTGQRMYYHKGKLSADRIKKLEAIGFTWELLEDAWEEKFAALEKYQEKSGHVSVIKLQNPLGIWCGYQRKAYKNGKLSPEKIKRLESLGFIWDVPENQWHTSYNKLKAYIQKHGWDDLYAKNIQMYEWVNTQRTKYNHKRLPENQIMLLNMLGINWSRKSRRSRIFDR